MSPSTASIQFFFTDPADVGDVPAVRRSIVTGRIIIAFIQTQVLFPAWRGPGPGHHDGLQRAFQQLGIMHIGTRDHDAQRTTIRFHHQAPLHPVFAAICWVLAHLIPPKRALPMAPSADCHRQSTPPRLSHAWVSFFQILCKTPLFTQR